MPKVIEAEYFDKGGEGVAYHDLSSGNSGGQLRNSENVDITSSTGATLSPGGQYVIGNFQNGRPDDAMIHAIARAAAWKLALFDRNPKGRIAVISTGSDKFRAGQRVVLPVMDGHRNTNDTDCPGVHLYRELDQIRALTAHRIGRFDPKEVKKLKAQI